VPLKNPIIFTILVLAVLLGASIVTYSYGLPLLHGSQVGCQDGSGGGLRAFGCSTSFSTFMFWVVVVVSLAIGGIWSKFGRQ
jgi:hypothetical protein